MINAAWKFFREMILYCSVGALCGAAIGFLMYLQLGPFKTAEDAGFATGIFVKSGVQLGFLVWMISTAVLALRHWLFDSQKKTSRVRPRFF